MRGCLATDAFGSNEMYFRGRKMKSDATQYTGSTTVYAPNGEPFIEIMAHGGENHPSWCAFIGSIEAARNLRDILSGCIAVYEQRANESSKGE